jgi:hypothetical protein
MPNVIAGDILYNQMPLRTAWRFSINIILLGFVVCMNCISRIDIFDCCFKVNLHSVCLKSKLDVQYAHVLFVLFFFLILSLQFCTLYCV